MYDYEDNNQPGIPHAVKAVDHPTGSYDAAYEYDENGNMTCRVEENITWVQEYNEENRIEKIHQVNDGCSDSSETGISGPLNSRRIEDSGPIDLYFEFKVPVIHTFFKYAEDKVKKIQSL